MGSLGDTIDHPATAQIEPASGASPTANRKSALRFLLDGRLYRASVSKSEAVRIAPSSAAVGVQEIPVAVHRCESIGDPLSNAGEIEYAQDNQHQAHGQFHGEANASWNCQIKQNNAAPTNQRVLVWPMPQSIPIKPARRMLRCRVTIVVAAITWSASVAWRIPSRNPTPITVSKLTIASHLRIFRPESNPNAHVTFRF